MWVDAALKKVKGEGSSVRVPVIRDESNKQLVHQDIYIHFLGVRPIIRQSDSPTNALFL